MKPAALISIVPLVLATFGFFAAASERQPERERALWQKAAVVQREYEQHCTVLKDPQLSIVLDTTLSRLWPHAGTELPPMILKVIVDPTLDAVTYPNGVCYITTGMLARLRNEAQLAMIVGHEMTHYVRRHALQAQKPDKPGNADRPGHTGERTSMTGSFNGNPDTWRAQAEKEADAEALHIIRQAGYDPALVIALLDGFSAETNALPASRHRRSMVSSIVKHAPISDSGRSSYRRDRHYLSRISAALMSNAKASIRKGLWDQAERNLFDYLTVRPDDAQAHFLRGELQRRNPDEGKMQQAILAYRTAIALDQGYAPAYRELGVVNFKLGRLHEARRFFQTYLALDPQGENSDFIRGYLNLCVN